MTRQKKRFYKSSSTKDLDVTISSGFQESSRLATSLAIGKFSESVVSGTSLEPLDIFRAAHIKLQEIKHPFIKNSIISLLKNSFEAHHSLATFLAAYFLDNEVESSFQDIMLKSRCATSKDADEIYNFLVRDDRTRKIFNQIRHTAGSSARIVVQKSPAKKDAVIYRQNNIYPLAIPQEFWRYTSKQKLEFTDVRTLIVDGVIMTVGEINRHLVSAFENKQAIVIVCRGFSEEVLATLLQNYMKGNLNVFPIQIPTGEMSNFLHDIGYLSDADVVSTITGDVLASKDEECLGTLENITFHKQHIEFSIRDKERRDFLIQKIKIEKENYSKEFGIDGDYSDVFEARLIAASAEICKVYISDVGIGQSGIIYDRINSLGKIHNEIKERGIIDLDNFNDKAFQNLKSLGFTKLPIDSLLYSIYATNDLREKLLHSSRVLTID